MLNLMMWSTEITEICLDHFQREFAMQLQGGQFMTVLQLLATSESPQLRTALLASDRPCLLHAGCSLSQSPSLGWLSLCQVCIVVSPSLPTFLPPVYPGCFFPPYLHLSVCFKTHLTLLLAGVGKAGGEMYFGTGSTETWGTDTLVQSGSPTAKTSGISWLLLSCTDDLWRHKDMLSAVKKQKNIARKAMVCRVPYFLQCGSRSS